VPTGIGPAEAVIIALALAGTVFWLFMLIDCLTKESDQKVAWVLVLVFLHALGAIIYWWMRYRPRQLSR
jgi:protein-S-isoprenylcysteine O-methyltransferase Ste14